MNIEQTLIALKAGKQTPAQAEELAKVLEAAAAALRPAAPKEKIDFAAVAKKKEENVNRMGAALAKSRKRDRDRAIVAAGWTKLSEDAATGRAEYNRKDKPNMKLKVTENFFFVTNHGEEIKSGKHGAALEQYLIDNVKINKF